MAAFPPYVRCDWRDLTETTDPVVERSEMERSIPKQRRIASDARVEVQLTVYFETKARAAAFEDWFFNEIDAGADFFDWKHPRLGTIVQARIVEGDIGQLTFMEPMLGLSKRVLRIEYWRSAW
ncbi:hypothetical protein [Aquincola tertiaricarbonis]|uniref:hypothetical protein n=1 Tax=Aquincola tertiaricarbonis TaxID=391953 RepID=UPI000697B1B8|nr:hypothetical protein [Aquincola tertiaricarbonis]